jgi:hypothetical protein
MSAEPTPGWSYHRAPFTFTRNRILQVAGIVVVPLIGALLPYLTLGYENFASQPVRPTESLFPAARLIRTLSIQYVPAAPDVDPDAIQRGVDLLAFGTSAHQVGMIVAILTCWGLFMDEINKFLWWPLHLSGWILVAGTIAVWAGTLWMQSIGVDIALHLGWIPLLIAGVGILVITFRARSRIDSYRGA